MGRVLSIFLLVVGFAVAFIPGLQAVAAGILKAGFGLTVSAAAAGAIVGGVFIGAGALLAPGAGPRPVQPFDPRGINPDVATPRKIVLGRGLIPLDLRYYEPSGENDEFIDYIFALAGHRIHALESLHIEDKLAWTPGGGAVGEFVGYLQVWFIPEGGAAAFHNIGAGWSNDERLTGCASLRVRVKRSDNSKNSQSPLPGGFSGRISLIGQGMPVYDPRRDSTVPGGSGSHRADNPATWQYTADGVDIGGNPVLQVLAVLLGWRINGLVSVGAGMPVNRLALAQFAEQAAIADELTGFERRYRHGRAFTDADDPISVVGEILNSCNGELIDVGRQLAPRLAVNDLVPAVTLTDDDLLGPIGWNPVLPVAQQFTVVRGRYARPDALFEFADLPEVVIPRPASVPRPLAVELPGVESIIQGQRVLKQVAMRQLFMGTVSLRVGLRGLLIRQHEPFLLSSVARGWPGKLFRLRTRRILFEADQNGAMQLIVEIEAREEDASIYAFNPATAASPIPLPAPTRFNQRFAASWLMAGIAPEADETRVTLPALPTGEWTSGRVYAEGDLAIFNAATYAARQAHTAETANRPPTSDFWALVAGAADSTVSRNFTYLLTALGQNVLSEFSCRAGSGGNVELSATCPFTVGEFSPSSNQMQVTIQRFTGSVWVDVGTAVTSASVAPGASGSVTISRTFASTPGTLTQFRLRGARIGPAYDPDTAPHEIQGTGSFTGAGT